MSTKNKERETRIAQRRIEGFAQEFGEVHRNLARHAAFPLVLTPDLLYQIWANFVPEAPWIAVAHVLLSRLCRQVGYEMYEMDIADRNLLLRELKEKSGQERFDELGDFLLSYVAQQLTDDNPDTRDLREAQEWTALAYIKPDNTAQELAQRLSERVQSDDMEEVLRLTSLIDTLAEPLLEAGFEPLLTYNQGLRHFARGDLENAQKEFEEVLIEKGQLKIAGKNLNIHIPSELSKESKTDNDPTSVEDIQQSPTFGYGRRQALVIGINKYPFLRDIPTNKVKHLTTAANDAEAIAQLLEKYGEFQVQRLPSVYKDSKLQVDSQKLIKLEQLKRAVTNLFHPRISQIPETAVLFFAGHGLCKNLENGTEVYLAASDASPRKELWGLSLQWLRKILQESPIRQQIVWLDCSYSGEFFNFSETNLGDYKGGLDRCFITASREFEIKHIQKSGEHGVLTAALLQGLNPTLQAYQNVTNLTLTNFLKQTLKDAPQHPIYFNSGSEIVLTFKQDKDESFPRLNSDIQISSNSKSLTKQPSLKTLETARILIVDNSPDNVSLVKTILEEEGYQVSTAENGIAGLSLIEDNSPDLIILEILMPEIDGYEITRRIRKNTKLPFIPILLITAHDSPNVAHGLDLGANDFIRKPVTVDELLARVRSLLRIKEMVRKAQSNI